MRRVLEAVRWNNIDCRMMCLLGAVGNSRTKCDNKSPKCTRCQTKGLECLYTRKMKKRGPTKGSATSVKERIARLEKLLEGGEGVDAATRRAVAQGLKELGSAEDGDYDDEEDEMFGSQSSEAGRGERAMVPAIDAGPLDAYSFGETGNFGMPEVTPELGTPGSWQLGSSSLAPAEPNYAPPPGLHSTPQPIYAPPPQLPTLPPLLGPPTGLGLPLFMDPTLYKSIVNTYIKIIWPTIPILHPPSLLENPSVYSEALLLLVLAMGIRFSHDPAVARYIASSGHADPRSCAEAMYTRAHAAAKLFLDDPGHAPNELDLFTTIHLTLFVGPMSGSLSAGLRWTEMNMVLLREIVLDDNADLSTQRGIRSEEKRRLFWFLFCFDRAYAFGSPSRNFAILQERALSTRLPVSDAVFSGEEPVANSWSLPSATLSLFATDLSTFPLFVPTLGFFAKLVLLFYIFSQIVELQRLPPAFQTEEAQMMIQLQLDAFYECLPMQDRTETLLAEPLPAASTDKPPMALFLLIPYYTIKTVLYSPPGSANPDNDEWLGSKAFLKSAEAAEMATRCVAAMFPGHIEMVPFWNVGRLHFCGHSDLTDRSSHLLSPVSVCSVDENHANAPLFNQKAGGHGSR